MVALTDVRLVLGERLGLRRTTTLELLEEQARAAGRGRPGRLCLAPYYDFLTWLQETLAQALMP